MISHSVAALIGAAIGFLLTLHSPLDQPGLLPQSEAQLFERYGESWGLSQGRLPLRGAQLRTVRDNLQWFNPCVLSRHALTNASIYIDLPYGVILKTETAPNRAWVLQSSDMGGTRISARLGAVNPGVCLNATEQLSFVAMRSGRLEIAYGVAASELEFGWRRFEVIAR